MAVERDGWDGERTASLNLLSRLENKEVAMQTWPDLGIVAECDL